MNGPSPSPRTLLPHEEPAVLVDEIVECDPERIICACAVGNDEHYGPGLALEGLIELCAQSAACFSALSGGGQRRLGVLAGVDDFVFHRTAVPGETLRVEAIRRAAMANLSMFECTVCSGEQTVAAGIIKVAIA